MAADAPPASSWAAAASKEAAKDVPLSSVTMDGHVVLKILRHAQESFPTLVTGQLLGLDINTTLEVTDCFPFPTVRLGEEEDGLNGAPESYQLDMMRCLREVNVDNNTVGWYQTSHLGSFQTVELIETFINYQESIKRSVCIICDPQQHEHGGPGLKAVKLKDAFSSAYKAGNLTAEKLKEAGIAWKDIFEEIPIKIHNSPLALALMAQIEPAGPTTQYDYDKLNLSVAPLLHKNLEFLNDCLDEIVAEQQKVSYYHRSLARQQQGQSQWLQKRRQENAQRRAAGEEPLPEEDPNFKPIPEPSPLDSFLVTNQVSTYSNRLNGLASETLQKLYLFEAFQKVHS